VSRHRLYAPRRLSRPPADRTRRAPAAATLDASTVLGHEDASLLDVVDNVLSKGVVVSGDVTIALAQVDLIYARLSLLLCAADRILPDGESASHVRRHERKARRQQAAPGE
jgi:hypothetical protein